jgi:hypothetical protein
MITYIDTQHIEGQRTPTPGCLESMVENCNLELIQRNIKQKAKLALIQITRALDLSFVIWDFSRLMTPPSENDI